MRSQASVVFDDRQTLAGWYVLGYCPDARAHLHHVVGRLDACCLDQQRELGRVAEKMLVEIRIGLDVQLVVHRHGASLW
jgi:hypothetical protein